MQHASCITTGTEDRGRVNEDSGRVNEGSARAERETISIFTVGEGHPYYSSTRCLHPHRSRISTGRSAHHHQGSLQRIRLRPCPRVRTIVPLLAAATWARRGTEQATMDLPLQEESRAASTVCARNKSPARLCVMLVRPFRASRRSCVTWSPYKQRPTTAPASSRSPVGRHCRASIGAQCR